jgi:hypothetical protein
MKAQMLLHVHKVTERYPDNTIKTTKWDHDEWLDVTHKALPYTDPDNSEQVFVVPDSTFANDYKTVRAVVDEHPARDRNNTRVTMWAKLDKYGRPQ